MSPAKDWKAIVIDWTALDDYDHDEVIGICLTQRQVAVLKACLIPAYWSTRWDNLTATADELDEFVAIIDNQLSGNDCGMSAMEFRDNPLDMCEVQYSNDGGQTWTTMFRKDVCVATPATTTTDISNIYNDIDTVNTNNTTWNNDITNVAPQWAYVDEFSDRALCWLIDRYVDWVCDFAFDQIESNNQDRRDENDWLDDIDALANENSSYFKDDDARQVVKCFMFNQIRGETPQFTSWAASLDNFDEEGAGVIATAIVETVSIFNQDTDTFINWMILMEDINSISASLPECDCPQPDEFDQLSGPTGAEMYGTEYTQPSSLPFSSGGDPPATGPGVWEGDVERYTKVISDIGGGCCNVRVALPPNRLVTQLQVRYGCNRLSVYGGGDKNYGAWVGTPYAGGVQCCNGSWGAGLYGDRQTTETTNAPLGIKTTPENYIYIHNSQNHSSSDAYIMWVHVETIPYVP